MKVGYLLGAVAITVMIVIIAFQNITTSSSFVMFFNIDNTPMTMPIIFLTVMGMISGSLYTLFVQSALNQKSEERREEQEGNF